MEALRLYTCPVPKMRLGRDNDGGYVIANLPGGYDLLLAGGVADDVSFEQAFVSQYAVPCYAFDGTVASLPVSDPSIYFVHQNIDSTTLEPYMDGKKDVFLKLDIEGHEFNVLPAVPLQRVKQLVVEVHSPADISMHPNYYKGLHDITNATMFSMLHTLAQTHTLIHFHANNGCALQSIDGVFLPHVFELTYVRNEYVPIRLPNTEVLPTSLDMRNIVYRPDYILSGYPYCH